MDEKAKKQLSIIVQMILLGGLFSSYWKSFDWTHSKVNFYSFVFLFLILLGLTFFRLILLSRNIENSKLKFVYLAFLIIFILIVIGLPQQLKVLKKTKEDAVVDFMSSVKSAVLNYRGDNFGRWPESLDSLVPHYLKLIPKDPVVGSQKIVAVYDGTGGWVYDQIKGEVSPNFPATIQDGKYRFQ